MNTIYNIDESQEKLHAAVHVPEQVLIDLSEKLNKITNEARNEDKPIGWVVKQIAGFTEEEALLTSTMFIAHVLNGSAENDCEEALKHLKLMERVIKLMKDMKDISHPGHRQGFGPQHN